MEKEDFVQGIPGTEYLIDKSDSVYKEEDGDVVLIPPPTYCQGDPLKWPKYKKFWQLFVVAFYACAFSFGENTLGAAWTTVSEDINVSINNMNGGSALNYLLLGFCNIFWIPTAMKYGRKSVFVLTTLLVIGAAIWIARCFGVAQWMLSMVLNGIGTSAYQAVIQLSVFDMFFVHERGRMLAVYLFGQQLGSVIGLVSGGKIADVVGWQWSQYIVAIINGVVLFLFLFTFEETFFPRFLFERAEHSVEMHEIAIKKTSDWDKKQIKNKTTVQVYDYDDLPDYSMPSPEEFPKKSYIQILRIWSYYPQDKTSYWQYFRRPFFLFLFPNVMVSGFIFAFGCTAGIVTFNTISEILTDAPYNYSTTTTGVICLGALVGNVVGWFTGAISDYVVLYFTRRNNGIKEPEMRLYTMCLPFAYASIGYMMYGWGAEFGDNWSYIAVGLGFMIAQQVSACSIATSYAMDCFRGISGELVVVLAICSSCINFAFSESVQPFIDRTGYGWAFFFFGMCVIASNLLAIPTIIWGKSWRQSCANKYFKFVAEGKQ